MKLIRCLFAGVGLFVFFSFLSVLLIRWLPVKFTPLMLTRTYEQWCNGRPMKISQEWVPIDKISSYMIHAVIASEDNKFVSHHGFDAEAIRKARKLNREGKKIYGASTISQQVSKNVFLWHGRSWVRKGLEAYYTAWLELLVPKKRIMEIYLNVAEFGDGVYGVEAASEFFFQQSSSKLRPKEAAVLAACLPNPLKNNPIKPTERLKKRQAKIMRLMSKINKTEWGVSF